MVTLSLNDAGDPSAAHRLDQRRGTIASGAGRAARISFAASPLFPVKHEQKVLNDFGERFAKEEFGGETDQAEGEHE
jgi:hypothetical protein